MITKWYVVSFQILEQSGSLLKVRAEHFSTVKVRSGLNYISAGRVATAPLGRTCTTLKVKLESQAGLKVYA